MDSHWMNPRTDIPSPALQAGAGALNIPGKCGSNSFEPQLYLCLHPFCEYRHPDEGALDRHVKTHFAAPAFLSTGDGHAGGDGYTLDAGGLAAPVMRDGYEHGELLLPYDGYGYGIPSTMTFRPDHAQQAFTTPTAIAHSTPGSAGSAVQTPSYIFSPLAPGIATPAASFPSCTDSIAAPQTLGITAPTVIMPSSNALTSVFSTSTPDFIPSTTTPLRHTCPTCNKTFARPSDLARHALKHNPLARRYECSVPGCKYVGSMGFTRKDKLVSHVRARHGG